MIREKQILLVLFFLLPIIHGLPSNSYYLIDIDKNLSSNESYCSNVLTNEHLYRIPQQCHHHLLCDPYYCDDKSFRCMKIRETLCCLHKYYQSDCQLDNSIRMKDLFRSVYFQMSIEHGYCEINLERIEKIDQAYCIANIEETPPPPPPPPSPTITITVSSTTRSSYKQFHRRPPLSLRPNRFRHRIAARQNHSSLENLDYLRKVTVIRESSLSRSSRISRNSLIMIILLLSVLI